MEEGFSETTALSTEELDQSLNEIPGEEIQEDKPAEEQIVEEVTEEVEEETPKVITQEDLDAVVAERETLKRRADNQDKLIARFGTEVGLLRKKSPEEERAELERIRDVFIDDPVEGQKALDDYNKKKVETDNLARESTLMQQETANRTAILGHVPDFENTIGDMAAMLKEDGVPEASIEGFKVNPYVLDHTSLFLLNKRAALAIQLKTVKSELEQLKTENERLKTKPEELANKIEKASKQKPLTGKTAGAAMETPYGDKLVTQMTNEELNAALQ